MGRRGPNPKPTALRVLQGNPGKRALNHREPKPRIEEAAPRAPRYLGRYAKVEWRRVVPELHRLGLLSTVDRAALEIYCEAYHRWRDAKQVLDERGLTYETETGYVRPRPEVKIAGDAAKEMKSLMAEFGLTPAARSRLAVPDPSAPDPFDEFLSSS